VWEVVTPPAALAEVRQALEAGGVELETAELVMRPTARTRVDDEQVGSLVRLVEALEEHDDVQAVHANFDADAGVLERVANA
jgi:transcriptional/translational regulatory protein YebC/TACO1